MFEVDPETRYRRFVGDCNNVCNKLESVLLDAHEFSSNNARSIALRRALLGCQHREIPTWNDLLRARLQWDLRNPDMFELSPQTKYVSIKLSVFHPNDVTAAAAKRVRDSARKKTFENFLREDVFMSTVSVMTKRLQSIADSVAICQSSLKCLFGLPKSAGSVQLVRLHVSKIKFTDRVRLVESFLEYVCTHKIVKISSSHVESFLGDFKSPNTDGTHSDTSSLPSDDNSVSTANSDNVCRILRQMKRAKTVNDRKGEENNEETFTESGRTNETQTGQMPNKADKPLAKSYLALLVQRDEAFVKDLANNWTGSNTIRHLDLMALPEAVGLGVTDVSDKYESCANNQIKFVRLATPQPSPKPLAFTMEEVFSESFVESLFDDLDQSLWMKGKRGRDQSFIRIATECPFPDDVQFQIAQHLHPAKKTTKMESAVLECANFLRDRQDGVLPKVPGQRPFRFNTVQTLAEYATRDSGYSRHSDCGRLLNSTGSIDSFDKDGTCDWTNILESLKESHPMPFPEETQTFTFVFLKGSFNKGRASHRVDYYDGEGNHLGSFLTTGNMMHAQLHGTQLYQHEVSCVLDKGVPGLIRLILSCRCTTRTDLLYLQSLYGATKLATMLVDPSEYKYRRIITAMSRLQDAELVSLSEDTYTVADCHHHAASTNRVRAPHLIVSKESLDDNHHQIDKEEYDQMNIYRRSSSLFAYPGAKWSFAFRGDVVARSILEHGAIPVRSRNKCNSDDVSTYIPSILLRPDNTTEMPRLFQPLDILPISAVASVANLSHNNRSHPPTSGDHMMAGAFLLTKSYKQYMQCIVDTAYRLAVWQSAIDDGCCSEIPDIDPVYIYGSGGAPQKCDAYACDITKPNKYTPNTFTSYPQSTIHKQNSTLASLTERRSVVALFIVWDEFCPFFDKSVVDYITKVRKVDPSGKAMFVNYYSGDGYTYGNEEQQEFDNQRRIDIELSKLLPAKSRQEFLFLRRFTEELHFKFRLNPLFATFSEWRSVLAKQNNQLLKLVHFPETNSNNVMLEISFEDESISIDNESISCDDESIDFTDRSNNRFVDTFILTSKTLQNGGPSAEEEEQYPVPEKLTTREITQHVAFVMQAGAARYLGRNLTTRDSGEVRCGPLSSFSGLIPTIYLLHPFPMAIRTYDVMPVRLRDSAVWLKILPRMRNGCWGRSTKSVSEEIFFMASLNRMSGRPNLFSVFSNAFPELCASPIPMKHNISLFLDFVEANQAQSKLFNPQHVDCIPWDIKHNEGVMRSVFEELAATSDTALDQLRSTSSRLEAINKFASFLFNLFEKHKTQLTERDRSTGKPRFLAHQIVSDLEEIYCEPFGIVEEKSVVFGHGSSQGIRVCKLPKQRRASNHQYLKELHRAITKYYKESEPGRAVLRSMCGLELLPNGTLVISLNRRPFSYVDVEHILCKIYLGACKTMSSRSTSRYPTSSKPGMYPLRLPLEVSADPDGDDVSWTMRDIEDASSASSMRNLFVSTPQYFLLPGEEDVLKKNDGSSINV